MLWCFFDLKSSPSKVTTTIVQATPAVELPIFEIATYEVSWHDIKILREDQDIDLIGLIQIPRGTSVTIYEYDARVKFGMRGSLTPVSVEEYVVVFKTSDIIIECLEAWTGNYKYVTQIAEGWGATKTIKLETLFDSMNGNGEVAATRVWTAERIQEASKNFKKQYETLYRACGFNVRWI